MKNILILGDINSSHTRNWLERIPGRFCKNIFSLQAPLDNWHAKNSIRLYTSGIDRKYSKDAGKINYLKNVSHLKRLIKKINPVIVHAHYATSYGILGAATGFHPYIISAWGSDIFDFPRRSFIHRVMLKWNLSKSDLILSTSKIMSEEIKKYSDKEIITTPFGIDLEKFRWIEKSESDSIRIGAIKSLESIYGIDVLVDAFYRVRQMRSKLKFSLYLAGDGSMRDELQRKVEEYNMQDDVKFAGRIAHDSIPAAHGHIDIFVNPSRFESFGVSVLEAEACGTPVIVSDAGGLPEVMSANVTGLLVPPGDSSSLAEAIAVLADDLSKRISFGRNARKFVEMNFNSGKSQRQIDDIYSRFAP